MEPGPQANTPTTGEDIATSIRHATEYAAAFDIEVWKEEQRRLFRAELQASLADQTKRLEVEFAAKDVERLEEVDRLRRELETMAKRLQTTGKVLAKRISNHEQREAAFEARRTELARNTEEYLHDAEVNHRRALEESAEKYNNVLSQLRERDILLKQAQQRVLSVQQEYDALQRVVSRLQSREGSEAAALSELRSRCETLAGALRELQAQHEAKNRHLETLTHEKEELVAACRLYKSQVSKLTTEYNAALHALQQQRDTVFAREKEQLMVSIRDSELKRWSDVGHSMHDASPQSVNRADVLGAQFLQLRSQPPPGATHTYAETEIGALRALVQQLQTETARDEEVRRRAAHQDEKRRKREKRKQRSEKRAAGDAQKSASQQILYAEISPLRANVTDVYGGEVSIQRANGSPPLHVSGNVGDVIFGETRRNGDSQLDRDDVSVSSMSSRGGRMPNKRDTHHAALRFTDAEHRGEQSYDVRSSVVSESDAIANDAPVSMSVNTSTNSLYPYVTLPESLSTLYPTQSASEEAHSTSVVSGGDGADTSARVSSSAVAPSSASAMFAAPDSLIASDSMHDIRQFVRRLKDNRDRLLETGVYQAEDSIVIEMEKKIRLYEHYLKAHFS